MAYLYIFLLAINLIIGFWGKKSKILIFLSYFMIIFLMALNTKGPDVGNYLYDYNARRSGQVIIAETGYNYLRYFFSNILNFDFFAFHLFITVICIALIHSTIKYTKVNENLIIGLFLSYLFFIDTIQIRNFIIESILIYAIRFLLTDKKFNTIKFILCIGIAFLFHKIALVYLVLLICKVRIKKPIIKAYFILSIIAFLFFLVSRTTLIRIIVYITELFGLKDSYSFTVTKLSFIPLVALYLAELFVIWFYKNKICNNKLSNKENRYLNFIINTQILFTISLVLLLININFYRIIRNMLILKYIAFAICLKRIPQNNLSRWALIAFICLSALVWFISDYTLIMNIDMITVPILTGNLLFNNIVNNEQYSLYGKILIILLFSALFSLRSKFNKSNNKIKR